MDKISGSNLQDMWKQIKPLLKKRAPGHTLIDQEDVQSFRNAWQLLYQGGETGLPAQFNNTAAIMPSENEVIQLLYRMPSWKAPGPDDI